MADLKPVRGTHDIMPDEMRRHRHVEETARAVAERFGFGEISLPIFEFTEVFARTLGETSDIVTKEMYTFTDKGGDSLTLRPEGTAGVARAFISNGLKQNLPLKLFYRGPMFRHERPQKGRQRQFHQVGVELLGVETPAADIEVILLGAMLLETLGLRDKVTLELNTLGDAESRMTYRAQLVDYLSDHIGHLSDESRDRLERNPLRVLDSKDEGDRAVVADAPLLGDCLNQQSQEFFGTLCNGLDAAGVAFKVNPRLVRGLDYYCHTAFEFTTETLGAQGTVLAGGRYDGLIEQMGGTPTPGIGWAAGVERLSMMLAEDAAPAPRPIVVVPVGDAAQELAVAIATRLRRAGFIVDLGYSGNVGKRMKRANKVNARVVLLMGDDELARSAATVRDLDSGEQAEVALADLESHLVRYRQGE
ncbi:MAG: histidine--tRNA ligase [Rhodospirillales bacterium]|nr:histidine--tRNA ligase [Rhodospirillales bacterium]